ncbi:hypothetical protein GOODEAATRI_010471, partial [Goodea atripinnis]
LTSGKAYGGLNLPDLKLYYWAAQFRGTVYPGAANGILIMMRYMYDSCRPCLKSCSGFWSPSLLVFAQLSFKTPARRPAARLRSGSDLHSPAAQCCAEDLHTCLSTLQPHYLDRREDFSMDGHYQAAALAHLPNVGPSSVVKTRPLPGVPVTAPVSPT